MTSPVRPEVVARLARRVDEHDETLRALSDTLIAVKDTVDRHTIALAEIRRTADGHTATLASHTATLASHGEMLTEILTLLRERPTS